MKTVFNNEMVAHTWAAGKQVSGRNSSKTFWFNYGVLYSYATPVARIVYAPGCTVALISRTRYSSSTGQQLYKAERATRHLWQFTVDALGLRSEGRHSEPTAVFGDSAASLVAAHAVNLAAFRADYDKLCKSLQRQGPGISLGEISDRLVSVANQPRDYARIFDVPAPVFETTADSERIYAARNTPARIKSRAARAEREAAEAAARDERQRLLRIQLASEDAPDLRAWKAGEARQYGARTLSDEHGGALVRVQDSVRGTLETSWGVKDIPADAARTMVGMFLAGGAHAARLVGQTIGDFTVRSVSDEWLKIGCHDFHVSELKRIHAEVYGEPI
ncbi:MAG: hypothetical protein ACHP7H_01480 [Hyphomicrobiales bacterium]